MKYIDFKDKKIPVGKRKVAYVKWAVMRGTDLIEAKRQANNKFGINTRCFACGKVFNLTENPDRCPFCGES